MNYDKNGQLRIKSVDGDDVHYLDDSVLYYVFPFNEEYYLSLDVHMRINLKSSYFLTFYARYFNF